MIINEYQLILLLKAVNRKNIYKNYASVCSEKKSMQARTPQN